MDRGDDALDRVVKQYGADAHRPREFKLVRGAEERFILPDRVALVVEDRPSAAHPARTDLRPAISKWPRFGLKLLLNFATEAVGVSEAVLDSGDLPRRQIGVVVFARQ